MRTVRAVAVALGCGLPAGAFLSWTDDHGRPGGGTHASGLPVNAPPGPVRHGAAAVGRVPRLGAPD